MEAWLMSLILNTVVNVTSDSKEIITAGENFTLKCHAGGLYWKYPVTDRRRVRINDKGNFTTLEVSNSKYLDTGLYKCSKIKNPKLSTETYLYVSDDTQLIIAGSNQSIYVNQTHITVPCRAINPYAKFTLITKEGEQYPHPHVFNPQSGFVIEHSNGMMDLTVLCNATFKNKSKLVQYTLPKHVNLPVPEVIGSTIRRVQEGQDITLTCRVNVPSPGKYRYEWIWDTPTSLETKAVEHCNYTTTLKCKQSNSSRTIISVGKQHAGAYKCIFNSTVKNKSNTVQVIVYGKDEGYIHVDVVEEKIETHTGNNVTFMVKYEAIPIPTITWTGPDGNLITTSEKYNVTIDESTVNLTVNDVIASDAGVYSLKIEAGNLKGQKSHTENVILSIISSSEMHTTVAVAAVILILLLVGVIYLLWRMVQERKRMNTITIQEITAFHEGVLNAINPDLEIDEQANLLPYNKDFEFPRDKLKLGKQLGNGAFGIVFKAEAEGLMEYEPFTIVAVKMVKSHADISHLKALMAELKVLMYIGHHLNVLNLLGACTVNLIQKELLVIVEYCRFGNLHSYLQRHRDTFINQIHPVTKVIDFNIGKDQIKSGEKVSMNPFGDTLISSTETMFDNSSCKMQSTSITGETTISNVDDSCGSSCPSKNANKWNITYRNDAGDVTDADPLSTKDLLSWSYQVAMGMDYLSSHKIVHADLAARNILLADDNVVKICDFGLARPLYEKLDYRKKGQDPLPIKWMALESIEYRIFSSKSDVWSFGVVLWEFFSLGKSPYPGIEVNETFLKNLLSGYRMAKPGFSTDSIYNVMLECWKANPNDRPNFSDLVERIGKTLDIDIKQHYLDLGATYVNQNETMKTFSDYISSNKEDQSEYISPEFQEHTYVNTNEPNSEALEMRDVNSDCDYKNVSLSTKSDYLLMSKQS